MYNQLIIILIVCGPALLISFGLFVFCQIMNKRTKRTWTELHGSVGFSRPWTGENDKRYKYDLARHRIVKA